VPNLPSKPKITKEAALRELAYRRGERARPGQFLLKDFLFDKQLAFVADTSPFKIAVTTRRAGKSVSCVADLTHTACSTPGCIVLYITLSRKNAKRLVWPLFKAMNDRFKLGGEVNESDLSIRYPNGSMLYLLGASDRSSIEDFRGLAIRKVYLDEGQSFPEYIEPLVDDVLGPALMDQDGQLILIGTPGPVPAGYFFDLTRNANWSQHAWSFFDNPRLPFLAKGLTHQDMLNRELKRRGVVDTDASIQREWFGRWVKDENSLVYHYDAAKNDYDVLPSHTDWTYILGVDLGFDDADALVVLAYSEQAAETYLIAESTDRHQDLTKLCGKIDGFLAQYPITKIIVDTGGLGKKITEEVSKRYSIPMEPAEKTRKAEYIELMNDALKSGRLKIKHSSLFAHDAQKVQWDNEKSTPDRMVISAVYHSDICDAVLYAWRESYSYTYRARAADPEYGTKAWSDAQADMMFQAEIERLQEQQGEPPDEVEIDHSKVQRLDRPRIRYQAKFIKKSPPKG